jgi:hypothetical protein
VVVAPECRWASVVSAYRANTTSPCSVTFSRPSDRPGRLRGDRPMQRPAAAAERAPRPWNSVSRTPCRWATHEFALDAGEVQGRAGRPGVLAESSS